MRTPGGQRSRRIHPGTLVIPNVFMLTWRRKPPA
jgi:hypothetical protein